MIRFKPMFWIILVVAIIVGGWYWFEGSWDRKLFRQEPGKTCVNIHPDAARKLLDTHPDTQVLDVRSESEFSGCAIPRAIHLSIGDPAFDEKASKLDREKPVLVYCAGGFRSRKAVEKLKALGFKHIEHLHRGYHSWTLSAGRE